MSPYMLLTLGWLTLILPYNLGQRSNTPAERSNTPGQRSNTKRQAISTPSNIHGYVQDVQRRPKHNHHTTVFQTRTGNKTWPYRDQVAIIEGDIMLGALMMVHERDEAMICGKIMPQGGLQATEITLYTIDRINSMDLIPGIKLGVRIKDDCDRDIYGLEQSVAFIRGE